MSQAAQDVGMVSGGPEAASLTVGETSTDAPSLLDYPATYLLIGINLAVYLLMCRFGPLPALFREHTLGLSKLGIGSGSSLSAPAGWITQIFTAPFSERTLTVFGSCIPGRVVALNEWWRLVTSIFVHVTLLHLLLNMWCLWNLGLFGEPLLGKPGLVAVYLLTGVAGMLQSVVLNWTGGQRDLVIAGASGAVFGLAGILIVLLSNRRLSASWGELKSLRLQVVFFALVNLLIGVLPGLLLRYVPALLHRLPVDVTDLPQVDNNAHVGGFLFGLVLGVLLFPRMTSGRSSYRARQGIVFGSAALLLVLLGYAMASFAHPGAA